MKNEDQLGTKHILPTYHLLNIINNMQIDNLHDLSTYLVNSMGMDYVTITNMYEANIDIIKLGFDGITKKTNHNNWLSTCAPEKLHAYVQQRPQSVLVCLPDELLVILNNTFIHPTTIDYITTILMATGVTEYRQTIMQHIVNHKELSSDTKVKILQSQYSYLITEQPK